MRVWMAVVALLLLTLALYPATALARHGDPLPPHGGGAQGGGPDFLTGIHDWCHQHVESLGPSHAKWFERCVEEYEVAGEILGGWFDSDGNHE